MALPLVGLILGPALLSAALSVLIVLSKQWHGKHTLDHDLEGVQKFHAHAVPRIGGVAIFASIAAMLLLSWLTGWNLLSVDGQLTAVLLLSAGSIAFVAGVVEDLTKRVSVRVRLIASIGSATAASYLLGATLDAVDLWGVDALLSIAPIALLLTAFVVAGGVNAVNIIDGFNGLASSVVIAMLLSFAAIAADVGDTLVIELAMLGIGATLGFLCVNYPSGRLFLGDGGAYLLGFWVAETGVLLLIRNVEVSTWQVLSVCAFPVIEVLYSMYRRRIVRQCSPGAPDGLHLHTLVYRRVVPRWFAAYSFHPWKRNAAVVHFLLPGVVLAQVATLQFGGTTGGSMVIVALQIMAYLVAYRRIVTGKWFTLSAPTGSTLQYVDTEELGKR